MDAQYSVPAGQSLQQENLVFPAYGLVVENITNQWYYEASRRRYIPPYQAGVTIPLVGLTTATLVPQAPGAIVQSAPIPNEYLTASYTDSPVPAGGGVNVSGASGPTVSTLAFADLAQGGQPATPVLGVSREWADAAGELHRLLSTGADAQLVDTVTALGGVLTGTLPNPGLAAGAVSQRIVRQGSTSGPTTTSAAPVAIVDPQVTINTNGGDVFGIYVAALSDSIAGAVMSLEVSLSPISDQANFPIWEPNAGHAMTAVSLWLWTGLAAGAYTFFAKFATNAGTLTANGVSRAAFVLELKH